MYGKSLSHDAAIFALPYLPLTMNYELIQPHIFSSWASHCENKAPFGALYYYHKYAN